MSVTVICPVGSRHNVRDTLDGFGSICVRGEAIGSRVRKKKARTTASATASVVTVFAKVYGGAQTSPPEFFDGSALLTNMKQTTTDNLGKFLFCSPNEIEKVLHGPDSYDPNNLPPVNTLIVWAMFSTGMEVELSWFRGITSTAPGCIGHCSSSSSSSSSSPSSSSSSSSLMAFAQGGKKKKKVKKKR